MFSTLQIFAKQQIFRLVQIESICRQQNKRNLKTKLLFGIGRKHCGGKRRKCWLQACSFPTMFSKALLFRVIKSWNCVAKCKRQLSSFVTFISCFPVGYREIAVKIFFDFTMAPLVKILIFMLLLSRLIACASQPDGNMTSFTFHFLCLT